MFFTHLKQSPRGDDESPEVEDSAVFVRDAIALELTGIVFVIVGQRERVRFGEQKKASQ